jgi:hypothetical protein
MAHEACPHFVMALTRCDFSVHLWRNRAAQNVKQKDCAGSAFTDAALQEPRGEGGVAQQMVDEGRLCTIYPLKEQSMKRALWNYALAAGVGAFALASTAALAQVYQGPPPPPAYGPEVGDAPIYGEDPPINGPFGGPRGSLFDYEGPNHGAQVRTPSN